MPHRRGKVIAYGSIFLDAASTGDRMIDLELPLEYYDRTTRPAGAYTLVISCATAPTATSWSDARAT